MLFSTSSATDGHYHLVYLPPNSPPVVSVARQHTHDVVLQPDGTPALAQTENHTHVLVDLSQPKSPKPLETDEAEVVDRKIRQFQEAWDWEEDAYEAAKESVAFREGEQWDEETKRALHEKNRAALTINQVAPMMETLSGIFRQGRTDIRFFPQENGDAAVADALSVAAKIVLSQNDYEFEEVDVFEDVAGPGRGFIECAPNFDTNIAGDLRIKHFPWDQVILGPGRRKDGSDVEIMVKWEWKTSQQLQQMFPDYEEQIQDIHSRFVETPATDMSDLDWFSGNRAIYSRETKQIRLLEIEEKEFYTRTVFTDPNTGFLITSDEVTKKDARTIRNLGPFVAIDQTRHRIRVTRLAGRQLLDDFYDLDRPVHPQTTGPEFSLIVAYAYKRGSWFEGKIHRAKDTQREMNKRRSQIVDIINTAINNGWITEKGQFASRSEFERFKQTVSTAGFVAEVNDISRPPLKIDGGIVSPSLVQLELSSLQSFREITNINLELLGQSRRSESGVAILHKQRQGLIGNEYLFDNYGRAKKTLGRQLLMYLADMYGPQRILRMVLSQAARKEIQVGGQRLDPHDDQMVQELQTRLNGADLLAYDVDVGETALSPTAQIANYTMLLEAVGHGVPIPPEAVISMAPIPQKQQILEMLAQAAQAAQQAEERKYQTEIQKTAMAKGVIPPGLSQ